MPLWTLFEKTTSTVLKEHQTSPGTADGSLPVGLDPSLAWLVESTAAEPPFDANTERLEATEAITIDATDTRTGTRVFTLTKVPLSAEQLDDKAVQASLKNKGANVRAISGKIRNAENITVNEMREVIDYIVLRDRLDL